MEETQDQATPSAQPAPAKAATVKKAPKRKKKPAKKATTPKAAPAKAPAAMAGGSLAAVYVVLGLLVIGTSFYTGYLIGKGAEIGPGKTGSVMTGTLQIIEYSDFQCPFCARALPTIEQIRAQYGDKVEIIYKQFPLESIHPDAYGAAIASECVREAGGDEAFWEYHDTLFANQGALDIASLKQYARAQGLNIDSCLDNEETAAKVRADMDEARSRGISGTPSFWIKDELVVGAQPFSVLSAKIDEKLAGGSAAPAPTPSPQPEPSPSEPVDLDDGNYVLGDDDAPVTVIEFTDFQCPFCKRAHDQTFPQLLENYIETGKVRYTIRNFPLPIHADAQKASEAAECAGEQGKYWEYVDALFVNQAALDATSLKEYASDLGLNTGSFNTCLDSGKYAQFVQDDMAVGAQAGVGGTPSFFINGNILVGAQPYSSFKSMIDAQLAN